MGDFEDRLAEAYAMQGPMSDTMAHALGLDDCDCVPGHTRCDCERYRTPALSLVLDERTRQDAKWGEQNHGDLVWSAILGEEVGEVAGEVDEWLRRLVIANGRAAQAVLKARSEGGDPRAILDEAVQCAAVSLAWVEALLRNGPKPGAYER